MLRGKVVASGLVVQGCSYDNFMNIKIKSPISLYIFRYKRVAAKSVRSIVAHNGGWIRSQNASAVDFPKMTMLLVECRRFGAVRGSHALYSRGDCRPTSRDFARFEQRAWSAA